jgi:hypothetical protein
MNIIQIWSEIELLREKLPSMRGSELIDGMVALCELQRCLIRALLAERREQKAV